MNKFKVGDMVVCQGTRTGSRKDQLAEVVRIVGPYKGKEMISVVFKKDGYRLSGIYGHRFILASKLYKVLE